MSMQFMRAASVGAAADGLLKTLPDEGKVLLDKIGTAVMSQLSAAKDADSNGEPVAAAAGPAPTAAPAPAAPNGVEPRGRKS